MSDTSGQVCEWAVDGLTLSGLAWGPVDGVPVLALHGWMDHAESFAELAPRLTGCRVVSVDLSGQGLSGHRAAHATYNIWDDLPQIDGLLDQLGWEACILLGHSRGANIAALFAAALPERVLALVSLDALVPEPTEKDFPETMRAFLLDSRKQKARPPRVFESPADYAARRQGQGNSPKVSEALAPRALERIEGGYRMRGDARLFASSAVKLTQADIEAVMRAIRCPVLNIWAEDGIMVRREKLAALGDLGAELIADYEVLRIPGDHHFHMDPVAAGRIADAVRALVGRIGPPS